MATSSRCQGGNHLVIHHTAIKTRNITLAIEFYSLLGFRVSTKFRAGPARAAWLELAPIHQNPKNDIYDTKDAEEVEPAAADSTSCRLELIEVPSFILNEPEGMRRRALDLMDRQDLLGHNHFALDVSDQIIQANESGSANNMTTWLQALNQTSLERSNRMLRMALEPRQQIIGQGVYELAFLYDADGALVELLNKQSELSQTMKSGWEPWNVTDFEQNKAS